MSETLFIILGLFFIFAVFYNQLTPEAKEKYGATITLIRTKLVAAILSALNKKV